MGVNWNFSPKNQRENSNLFFVANKRLINKSNHQVIRCNLDDEELVRKVLLDFSINCIVNLFAITDLQKCEDNFLLCNEVNALIPKKLLKIAKELSIDFVQISSDHLFNKDNDLIFEDDSPCPLNNYALTKYQAEKYSLSYDKSIVIRTNFFGWGTSYRKSLSDFLYYSLKGNKEIIGYNDILFNPVHVRTLIDIIYKLLDIGFYGLINVSSDFSISKYDFAYSLAKLFNLDLNYLKKGLYSNNNELSSLIRPKNMALSNSKLKKTLGIENLTIDKELDILKEELDSDFQRNLSEVVIL